MRVLCFVSTLRVGGAERVACNLANAFAASGNEVILVASNAKGPLRESLSSEIRVIDLNCSRALYALPQFVSTVSRIRPDVILTIGTHVNALCGLIRGFIPLHIPVIGRETSPLNHIFSDDSVEECIGPIKKHLLQTLVSWGYPKLDHIVCESNGAVDSVLSHGRVDKSKIQVVYNPVSFRHITSSIRYEKDPFPPRSEREATGKRILLVGRLAKVKAFARAIRAFPSLLIKYPGSTLTIVGQGEEEDALKDLARSLGLLNCTHFVGFDSNPWKWMGHADLFLLCSEYENMPNILVEAIASECPLIALRIPGGVDEMLTQVGLESRIVDSLDSWESEWFDPLPDRAVSIARDLFDETTASNRYFEIMDNCSRARAA